MLLENIKYILIAFQFVTAIVGTFYYYYKSKSSLLKYILYFLWYTCFNDVLGLSIQIFFEAPSNFYLYNIYQFIRFVLLLYIYRSCVKKIVYIKIISVLIGCYISCYIINFFIESFWDDYFINTFIIGASFLTIAIFLYLFEVLHSNKILYISESLLFWLSFANLIYFVPNIPFYIIRKYYSTSSTIPYIFMVNYFLILAHYTILILGFIWSKPKIKQ